MVIRNRTSHPMACDKPTTGCSRIHNTFCSVIGATAASHTIVASLAASARSAGCVNTYNHVRVADDPNPRSCDQTTRQVSENPARHTSGAAAYRARTKTSMKTQSVKDAMTDATTTTRTNSMPCFVALLRAVNVGGTGKLPMSGLTALCTRTGFGSVRTYVASGNVIFTTTLSEPRVKAALEAGRHTVVSHQGSVVRVANGTARTMNIVAKLAELAAAHH